MFAFLYNLLFPKAWVADSSGNDHDCELDEIKYNRMTCLPFVWKHKTASIRNPNAETYSILHKS
jgi:hypothetical protein